MDRRKALILASMAAAVGSTSLLAGCGGGGDDPPKAPPAGAPNIVQLAQATPSLSILVEAVVAAGLAETLSGDGPFTVFAPNNDAFVSLLGELGVTKDALLKDKALLTTVLTYHVLGAKVEKAAIPVGKKITSLQKGIFKIDVPAGGVLSITDGRNRNSKILATDIQASNGVVHVIDKVILPANKNIVETAQALKPEFTTLVAAVIAADLAATLSGPGPFTVFAPTNAAFIAAAAELKLPGGVGDFLLPANKALLIKVLTYHVVSGTVLKAEIPVGAAIPTVQGETLSIGADFKITDQRSRTSQIIITDVLTSNGVIHAVDKVILPKP